MADFEFDRLEDELAELLYHPVLSGDGVVMLSLENNRYRSFDEWYAELLIAQPLWCSPRLMAFNWSSPCQR